MKGQVHVGCVSEEVPLYLCKSAEGTSKKFQTTGKKRHESDFQANLDLDAKQIPNSVAKN